MISNDSNFSYCPQKSFADSSLNFNYYFAELALNSNNFEMSFQILFYTSAQKSRFVTTSIKWYQLSHLIQIIDSVKSLHCNLQGKF